MAFLVVCLVLVCRSAKLNFTWWNNKFGEELPMHCRVSHEGCASLEGRRPDRAPVIIRRLPTLLGYA